MAIKKKIQIQKIPNNQDALREEIISRGGSVIDDAKEKKEIRKWKNICLRIPEGMIEEIDKLVGERIGLNRTAWILETIQERLNHLEK